MTHDLIVNYGLYKNLAVYRPEPATFEQMARFHSEEYLSFLRAISPETIGEHIQKLAVTATRHPTLHPPSSTHNCCIPVAAVQRR